MSVFLEPQKILFIHLLPKKERLFYMSLRDQHFKVIVTFEVTGVESNDHCNFERHKIPRYIRTLFKLKCIHICSCDILQSSR